MKYPNLHSDFYQLNSSKKAIYVWLFQLKKQRKYPRKCYIFLLNLPNCNYGKK